MKAAQVDLKRRSCGGRSSRRSQAEQAMPFADHGWVVPGQGAFEIVGELARQSGGDFNVRELRLRQLRLAPVRSLFVKDPRSRTLPGLGVGEEFAELGARGLVGAADSFQLVLRDLCPFQSGDEVAKLGLLCLGGEASPVVLCFERDCLEPALNQLHPLEFSNKVCDRCDQYGGVPAVEQVVWEVRAAGDQAARVLKGSHQEEQ